MINFDYNKIYDYEYYIKQLYGIDAWKKRTLKFGDNIAALSYACDIHWETLVESFPDVFNKNKHGDTFDHNYNIFDIEEYIKKNQKRHPRVLEIGGGRGELSNLMTVLGFQHISVEVCLEADRWYQETGKHFYGEQHKHQSPIIGPIETLLADNKIALGSFDTIILAESVEHIPTPNFNYVFDRIAQEFRGKFIVTNWKYYHPIVGCLDSPHMQGFLLDEHVADINDEVYARWASKAKKLVYKDGSHLVLEF